MHTQDLKAHGFLAMDSVSAALKLLVSQPNSTAIKEHELSEDLAFLAQQLRSFQAQGYR
jgi:hypothetical protein